MFGKGGVHGIGTVVFTVIAWGRRASAETLGFPQTSMQAPREKPLCRLQKLRRDRRWTMSANDPKQTFGPNRPRSPPRHVRFTPDSGHSSVQVGCPKSANSRHSPPAELPQRSRVTAHGLRLPCRQTKGR